MMSTSFLPSRLSYIIRLEPFDDALLAKYFARFYQKLYQMDELKYLPPRFSYAMKDLATHYGIYEKAPNHGPRSVSSASSNLSFQQIQFNNSPFTDSECVPSDPLNTSSIKKKTTPELNKSDYYCPDEKNSKFNSRGKQQPPVKGYRQQQRAAKAYLSKGRKPSSKPPVKDHRATIHNNNIIITINKSFNMGNDARNPSGPKPDPQRGKNASNAMNSIYSSSSKPRRGPNNTRISPTRGYQQQRPGDTQGKIGVKYMTQRMNMQDIMSPHKKGLEKTTTMPGNESRREDISREFRADSGNYSDLEVIKEKERMRGRPSADPRRPRPVARPPRRQPKCGPPVRRPVPFPKGLQW